MLQQTKSYPNRQKTHENESLLLVSLHVPTWCMRNNNHWNPGVHISISRFLWLLFLFYLSADQLIFGQWSLHCRRSIGFLYNGEEMV
jgi:hypothetical protein